jgi:nucleoside-diphosphate-sugar epimerase
MKVLFIGGTGNISKSVSELAVSQGTELYLLNRGTRPVDIPGAKVIKGDIRDIEETRKALAGMEFDVVVDWIAFTAEDVCNDIELFRGRTGQYIFISSASAYQKPLLYPYVDESTPLKNPYLAYSQNKIAGEDVLTRAYREEDFPVTIVRPSLTYDINIPAAMGGGPHFTLIDRMRKGKEIISHGDGNGLWTITHSIDFAKGFVGLMGNLQTIGHAFHITSDELLTWDQIYQAIAAAVGTTANIVHIPIDFIGKIDPPSGEKLMGDKGWSPIFDNRKIKKFVPDFKATIPFAQGIKRTVAWFEADKSRQIIDDSVNETMDKILRAYKKL